MKILTPSRQGLAIASMQPFAPSGYLYGMPAPFQHQPTDNKAVIALKSFAGYLKLPTLRPFSAKVVPLNSDPSSKTTEVASHVLIPSSSLDKFVKGAKAKARYIFSPVADAMRIISSLALAISPKQAWIAIFSIIAGVVTAVGGLLLVHRMENHIKAGEKVGDTKGVAQAKLLKPIGYLLVVLGLLLILKFILPIIGLAILMPALPYLSIIAIVALNIYSIKIGLIARQEVVDMKKQVHQFCLAENKNEFLSFFNENIFINTNNPFVRRDPRAPWARILKKHTFSQLESVEEGFAIARKKQTYLEENAKKIEAVQCQVLKELNNHRRLQNVIIASAMLGFTVAALLLFVTLIPYIAIPSLAALIGLRMLQTTSTANSFYWFSFDIMPLVA